MEMLEHHLPLQCTVCLKFCNGVLIFWKCVLISSFFSDFDLADKNLQMSANPNPWDYPAQSDDSDLDETEFRAEFKILFDGYRKMLDQSFSLSKDLGDMLRFLPGVVVQNHMSMQGMVDLYRIKPDLLERLIKSTIQPLKPLAPDLFPDSRYILDDYLSGFLQDQDRSQFYYCDPILQHVFICRQILSLLDGSFDIQSYVFRLI